MVKTLSKHGNSWALVIEKPILDLLNIDENTPLVIRTNGRGFVVEPEAGVPDDLDEAMQRIEDRYESVFRRLAE